MGLYSKADDPKDCFKIFKVASGTMSSDPFLSIMYIMVPFLLTILPDLSVELFWIFSFSQFWFIPPDHVY